MAVSGEHKEGSLGILNGSFSWAEEGVGNSTLADITLSVKPGQLLLVIGEVSLGENIIYSTSI